MHAWAPHHLSKSAGDRGLKQLLDGGNHQLAANVTQGLRTSAPKLRFSLRSFSVRRVVGQLLMKQEKEPITGRQGPEQGHSAFKTQKSLGDSISSFNGN